MDFKTRVERRNSFDASSVYGTRKFNLATKREEHMAERSRNDDQWTDPATGIIAEKYAQRRKCPLCGVDDTKTLFIKCGFPHVLCRSCALVYVNPILNSEEYEKHYRNEHSWERVLESEDQIKMQTLESEYSLDVASLYLDSKKISVCDIGCGPGTLLKAAQQRGYEVFGIEPNEHCHTFLREAGISYHSGFFPLKEDLGKQFDCVFFLNALEHMRQPLEVLLEVKKLVKPGKLIYISVPNINALVNRIMHEKASVFAGHSHLQFFNNITLQKILEKAGFEMLEYETIITQIGTIKNYLAYEDPYFGDTQEEFPFITPEMMYKYHLARNINVVGRRII